MAIIAVPKPTDPKGKCSRWRIILYNRHTHKQEWYTRECGKREAEAFEREMKQKLGSGTYIAKTTRKTFAAVVDDLWKHLEAHNRRPATIRQYESLARLYLLPEFEHREMNTIRRRDAVTVMNKIRESGKSAKVANKVIATAKVIFNFAQYELECIESNPFARMKPFKGEAKKKINRGAFTEEELQAIFRAAKPNERPLFLTYALCGFRPQEVYGLAWGHLDLDVGVARVERVFDHCAKDFGPTKSKHGVRVIELPAVLVEALREYRERVPHEAGDLVFPNTRGKPLNQDNVRNRIWRPALERAGVRYLDMYSMRHTFASLLRNTGVQEFVAARLMGHGKSAIVDKTYAHMMPSSLKGTGEQVAGRVFGKLTVIDGGKRDVRQPLDKAAPKRGRSSVSA